MLLASQDMQGPRTCRDSCGKEVKEERQVEGLCHVHTLTRGHICMQVGHVPALQDSSAAFASLFRQARSTPGSYRPAGAVRGYIFSTPKNPVAVINQALSVAQSKSTSCPLCSLKTCLQGGVCQFSPVIMMTHVESD